MELDFQCEASNSEKAKSFFKGDETVYIPEVYHVCIPLFLIYALRGIPRRKF